MATVLVVDDSAVDRRFVGGILLARWQLQGRIRRGRLAGLAKMRLAMRPT